MALTWINLGDEKYAEVEVIRTWNKAELERRINAIGSGNVKPEEAERDSRIVAANVQLIPTLWDLTFLRSIKEGIDSI